MKQHALYFILGIISSVHGQWLVRTYALNCTSAPFYAEGANMNCIHDAKNNYQKIECDMHAGTYKFYMCTSSACNDCKETINGLLSSCAGGITHFCYPKTTPNYSKFVGKNFAQDNMYNEPNCEGDIFLSTVYPFGCRSIYNDMSFNSACVNNTTVEQHMYDENVDCSDHMVETQIVSTEICTEYHKWSCN